MSTTRHRAGFETGNHSSSPLQGAITRGALHVPQRTQTEGRHTASQKRKRKRKRKRALVTQSLGVSVQNHASAGGKKVDRDVSSHSLSDLHSVYTAVAPGGVVTNLYLPVTRCFVQRVHAQRVLRSTPAPPLPSEDARSRKCLRGSLSHTPGLQ
jgi:hypothetical protein